MAGDHQGYVLRCLHVLYYCTHGKVVSATLSGRLIGLLMGGEIRVQEDSKCTMINVQYIAVPNQCDLVIL